MELVSIFTRLEKKMSPLINSQKTPIQTKNLKEKKTKPKAPHQNKLKLNTCSSRKVKGFLLK